MSDHSSHFDSVLGTAINLGIHAVNEKTGALQHHKVSSHVGIYDQHLFISAPGVCAGEGG